MDQRVLRRDGNRCDEAAPLRPPHADLGQLLHALRRQCRRPGSLVADPGAETQRPLLLFLAAVLADGDGFDVLPVYPEVPLAFVGGWRRYA